MTPLATMVSDFRVYAEQMLRVLSKGGVVMPFVFNAAQVMVHEAVERQLRGSGRVRVLALKARQQGVSTYVSGRMYWRVTTGFGRRAWIMTHVMETSEALFGIVSRYHRHMDPVLRPSTSKANARELRFDQLDGGFAVTTAGGKGQGKGHTAQYFHGSEVAFWPRAEESWASVAQIVSDAPGTEIILETTGGGPFGMFHDMWCNAVSGSTDYTTVFVPWFVEPAYAAKSVPADFAPQDDYEGMLLESFRLAPEQVMWRRRKLADDYKGNIVRFRRDYPISPEEAFCAEQTDAVIPMDLVIRAARSTIESSGPLVVGVDPAGTGDNNTAIIRRRGRVAYGLERHSGLSGMEVAGIVARIINEEKPKYVLIDAVGLGAPIYDRLVELGFGRTVIPVDSRKTPAGKRAAHCANTRAALYMDMLEWLQNPNGVRIPDDKGLTMALCTPKLKVRSSGAILIESKQEMRARNAKSPDEADALALTFAMPIASEPTSTSTSRRARSLRRRSAMAG